MKITKIAQISHSLYDIRNIHGQTIYSAQANSFKECVEKAIREKVNLSEANLSGAILPGANLSGAILPGANLSMTDLSEANLYKANLTKANLTGTNLSYATLHGTILRSASLIDANLLGADLTRTNLIHAVGVDLRGSLNSDKIIDEEDKKEDKKEEPKQPEDIPINIEDIPEKDREILELLGENKKLIKTAKQQTTNFPIWLHQQILEKTENFKKPFPLDEEQLELLTNWAHETNPDLVKLDILTAYSQAKTWDQLRLVRQYKNNKPVFKWKDGWKIVEVPQSSFSSRTPKETHIIDLEIERELMKADDVSVEDYKNFYGTLENCMTSKELPIEDASLSGQAIYSLRDPQNIPRATIEIRFDKESPRKLYVHDIFTNEKLISDEIHPRNNYIKEFFTYLKSQGYKFAAVNDESGDKIKATQLEDAETEDQFGLPYELWGVGGSNENYFDGLMEAYNAGAAGSYWYQGTATKVADNLIAYAEERDELSLLESALTGYSTKGKNEKGEETIIHKGFEEESFNWWIQQEDNTTYEHSEPDEPNKEDFMIPPDTSPQQEELKNMPPAQPRFNKAAYELALKEYNEALKAYEEERNEAEENFEPYIFKNYVYTEIQKAKERQQAMQKIKKKKADMTTKIIKTADKIDDKLPSGEQMALYVKTLKQYLIDNPTISEEWKELIRQLPSPRMVRQEFSIQELKLIYETVEFLWKQITGQKIIEEETIIKAPETLHGNYWLLCNGILLEGINHYSVAKQNSQLICSLLNIGGMSFQEYLGSNPCDLIFYIIKNGGIRLFISKDRVLFCQMSPETYAKFGRNKIKNLDFKKKVVKIIDLRTKYTGWKNGISVLL